jgi:GDSL-like Lipase/Acylhydrolase family
MTMGHIALLGDSIFDNRAYTGGEPDVVTHLRDLLPHDWRATLYAVDGATTADIPRQTTRVDAGVSHLVVSIGGNDALGHSDLLALPVRSTAEALSLFAERVAAFERAYRAAVQRIAALGRPTTLCTIYNGNLEPSRATIARVALTTFNDVILRVAFEHGLPVIDLRAICARPEDYANPIEPSGIGGRKIAAAIVAALGLGGDVPASRVFARSPSVDGSRQ